MATESIKINNSKQIPRSPSHDLISKSLDYSSFLTQQPRYVFCRNGVTFCLHHRSYCLFVFVSAENAPIRIT